MKHRVSTAIDAVRRTLPTAPGDRSPGYECAYCHLGYDRDRLNCPACGGPVRKGV